jgi:hypothetical protein
MWQSAHLSHVDEDQRNLISYSSVFTEGFVHVALEIGLQSLNCVLLRIDQSTLVMLRYLKQPRGIERRLCPVFNCLSRRNCSHDPELASVPFRLILASSIQMPNFFPIYI